MEIIMVNIEAERARLQLTKEQLSEMLGITSTTYLKYVRGANIPSETLLKMRSIFNCSVDYLLGITTNKAS